MNDEPQSDELVAFATRPENLYNALYWEVAWKNHSLRTKHFYLDALLTNGEKARSICSDALVELVLKSTKELRRRPKVLDIGCGPVSSIAYLVHENLAEVLGLDPLAEEYAELLRRHNKVSPVEQGAAHGEFIDEIIPEESCDIVFVRNALDHTQSPCLTWLNMFKATRTGGFMMQSHSIREATKENWKQLHQFDLYPDDSGHLWLEDAFQMKACLTSSLPLEIVSKSIDRKDDGYGWATIVYRKMDADWRRSSYLDVCLRQMRRALRKRSNAAMELERFVAKQLEERDPSRYPYKADIVTRA